MTTLKRTTVIVTQCPACGYEREIQEGEIPQGDYPLCPNDGMPLIAQSAKVVKR